MCTFYLLHSFFSLQHHVHRFLRSVCELPRAMRMAHAHTHRTRTHAPHTHTAGTNEILLGKNWYQFGVTRDILNFCHLVRLCSWPQPGKKALAKLLEHREMERQSSINDFFKSADGGGNAAEMEKKRKGGGGKSSTSSKASQGAKRIRKESSSTVQPSASASINSESIPTIPLNQEFEGDALAQLSSLGGASLCVHYPQPPCCE